MKPPFIVGIGLGQGLLGSLPRSIQLQRSELLGEDHPRQIPQTHLALQPAAAPGQDDYALPADQIPIHPVFGVPDWDDPEGAMDWPALRTTFQELRQRGALPAHHVSHDHLNAQIPLPIPDELIEMWKQRLEPYLDLCTLVLCEGFVMYWDETINSQFDVKFLLREEHDLLLARRRERNGYYTQSQSDAAGDLWVDPPDYWDHIVWPAYLKAHRHLFTNQDPLHGTIDTSVPSNANVVLLDVPRIQGGMAEMINLCGLELETRLKALRDR